MADEKEAKQEEAKLEEVEIAESASEHQMSEAKGDRRRVRLISPGWGSSGYYSADLLKKAVESRQFDGKHNFWDHRATLERSERSLRNLAGFIEPGSVQFLESGKEGPGVYANATVFPPYRDAVEAMQEHIGMSIVGNGKARQGAVEGRKGSIFETIAIESVDYVTRPGRGGAVLEAFESKKGLMESKPEKPQEESEMPTETEEKEVNVTLDTSELTEEIKGFLSESMSGMQKEMQELKETQRKLIAESEVSAVIRDIAFERSIPEPVVERVTGLVRADKRLAEENFDAKSVVAEVMEAEMRYVRSINPTAGYDYGAAESEEDLDKVLKESMATIFGDHHVEEKKD